MGKILKILNVYTKLTTDWLIFSQQALNQSQLLCLDLFEKVLHSDKECRDNMEILQNDFDLSWELPSSKGIFRLVQEVSIYRKL